MIGTRRVRLSGRLKAVAFVGASLILASFGGPALTSADDHVRAATCAAGYVPCLPVRQALSCREIDRAKKPVRVTGADRYRLDPKGLGVACLVATAGPESAWGLILRSSNNTESRRARIGDELRVVGWSPRSAAGKGFQLCAVLRLGGACLGSSGNVLNGRVTQTLGVWKVQRDDITAGALKVTLLVGGKIRAVDSVLVG